MRQVRNVVRMKMRQDDIFLSLNVVDGFGCLFAHPNVENPVQSFPRIKTTSQQNGLKVAGRYDIRSVSVTIWELSAVDIVFVIGFVIFLSIAYSCKKAPFEQEMGILWGVKKVYIK